MSRTWPAAVLVVLALAGCTGDTAPEPTPTASSAPAAQPEPTTEPSPAASVDVAASSREVLDAASAAQAARDQVLASQTVEVPLGLTASETGEVTVDVRRVERREASTLVTIGLSAAEPGTQLAPDVFSDRRDLEQLHQVALEDPAGGERYLPLSWRRWISTPDNLVLDGPANTCVCPSRAQLLLGPEPVLMDVLYGPLPDDVTTVSVTSPDGLLAIPDVPVGDAG